MPVLKTKAKAKFTRKDRFELPNGLHGESGEARLPGSKITTRWELITPATAEKYKARVGRNRTFSDSLSARYHADMADDQWLVTHQGIAFDAAGELVDGQHRCDGIIASGKSQWMLVTRGLGVEAIEALDRGRLRTLAHTLQILGYDMANNRSVAIARAMIPGPAARGGHSTRLTDISTRKFMETHREAILFAQEAMTWQTTVSQVLAVVARAYYHTPPTTLQRFALAFLDEIPAAEQRPGDKTARVLFKYLLGNRTGMVRDARTAIYRKTQNAVRAYLDGRDLGKLYEAVEDLFPLPGTEPVDQPAAE